jgi:hypothetical protein
MLKCMTTLRLMLSDETLKQGRNRSWLLILKIIIIYHFNNSSLINAVISY